MKYWNIHLYLSYLFLCIPKHNDTYKIMYQSYPIDIMYLSYPIDIMYQSYPIDIIFRNLLCGIVFFNSFHECHVHSDTNNVLRVDCCSWICILWEKKFKQWWKPIPLILTIKKQSRLILIVHSQCPITITRIIQRHLMVNVL